MSLGVSLESQFKTLRAGDVPDDPAPDPREVRAYQLRSHANVPRRFSEARLNTPPPGVGPRWSEVAGYLRRLIREPGIVLLHGKRGVGKTWLGCGLVADALRASDGTGDLTRHARYDTMPDVTLRTKAAWDTKGRTEEAVVEQLCRPRILVLDEIHERAGGEWDGRLLRLLVDRRYASELATVLITNLTIGEFREAAGESIVSRMAEDAGAAIECSWGSQRRPSRPRPEGERAA